MANRISLKLTDKNDWLTKSIEEEKIKQNRPSINNMIETILVSFFKKENISTIKKNTQSPSAPKFCFQCGAELSETKSTHYQCKNCEELFSLSLDEEGNLNLKQINSPWSSLPIPKNILSLYLPKK